MSKEKECKCCQEEWYAVDIKDGLCPNCYDYFKQLKQQLEEKEKEIVELKAEPQKIWDDNLRELKNDIVDKFIEKIHKEYRAELDRRVDKKVQEKTKELKYDFENQRRLLTENFSRKVDELQTKCDKHFNARIELMKNQKTFAINELEKIKKFAENYIEFKDNYQESCLYEQINKQIKELKDN